MGGEHLTHLRMRAVEQHVVARVVDYVADELAHTLALLLRSAGILKSSIDSRWQRSSASIAE